MIDFKNRIGVNRMKFPIRCDYCREWIFSDERVYTWKDKFYCSQYCVQKSD